jgi:hypothetical protein
VHGGGIPSARDKESGILTTHWDRRSESIELKESSENKDIGRGEEEKQRACPALGMDLRKEQSDDYFYEVYESCRKNIEVAGHRFADVDRLRVLRG